MSQFRFHPLSVLLLIAVSIWSAFVWRGRMDDLSDLSHRVGHLEHATYVCTTTPDDTRICTTGLGIEPEDPPAK